MSIEYYPTVLANGENLFWIYLKRLKPLLFLRGR